MQLLERGRAAFGANDFVAAEEALEKFILDYGPAEEAKEAARIHRPLVALCKVGLKKFDQALKWIDESLVDPQIDPALADELRFWRGLCLMSTQDLVGAQRAFGEYWTGENHNAFKRYEALLLFAHLYLLQGFPEEAADFLESQLAMVREASPEAASRAVVLELHARMEAGQKDQALAVIRRESPHFGKMTQVVSFQTLMLQLGAGFLEEKRFHEAITCFQHTWPSAKLTAYQNQKATEIRDRIALLEPRPDMQGTVFQLRAILKRVERELEHFQTIEHFDSALRLRLAMAYQGLERYREAALILEEMVVTMPPDPVVESAALAQIQCWMETKHWLRAAEAAERYETVFGAEGRSLPTVLFLKAEAFRENLDQGKAQLAYGELVERFPKDPFAAKALFMQGFLYLQQDDNEGAIYQFEQVQRRFPESEMVDDADYWTGMAYSLSSLYAEAREHLVGYLKRHREPSYRKEAVFRIAVCTFSLAEYPESIAKLEDFVRAYSGDALTDEAWLLLGDACFGVGKNEEGFAAYEKVRPESGRFFEEAWFKKGNALRLLEEIPAMRTHFEKFVADYPASGRLPEAVYWIGWTHLEEGEVERARSIYWKTIEDLGDDPARSTITHLFTGLQKIHQSDGAKGREELLAKLKLLKSSAALAGKTTLALRAGWAEAQVQGDPEAARLELLSVAKWVNPKLHEPVVSIAVAEAQLASGNRLTAKDLLTEIRKWHPRAVERDRIYRALGGIAEAEGDKDRAIGFYERFERETAASVQLGEVRLRLADLLEKSGRGEAARETLGKTLEAAGVTADVKAHALLRLGEMHASMKDHRKAAVYFERIYVAYGKFADLNAKAYWSRGQSLEQLDLGREALETYQELILREDLREFPERNLADQRIAVLKERFPDPGPVNASDGKEEAL